MTTKEKPPGADTPSGLKKSPRQTVARTLNENKLDLVAALERMAEDVARGELGEPTQRTRSELRFGRKGSLKVNLTGRRAGYWYDHEAGQGGNLLDLIMHVRGVSFKDALAIGREYAGGTVPVAPRRPAHKPEDVSAERKRKRAYALRIWNATQPLAGTLSERYLSSRGRCIDTFTLDHTLRHHEADRMMVAKMVDPTTGHFVGVHRTLLDEQGNKVHRKMLGGRGVICLTPFEDIATGLGIAEGIEDAMLWLYHGWPIWAVTCADSIRRFPVLAGIEELSVFADADLAGLSAANDCALAWSAAGVATQVVSPPGNHNARVSTNPGIR